MRPVAELTSPRTNFRLRVTSTKPGVQIYDGHMLDVPIPGLGGLHYGARAGICVETQFFPDSPNQPRFPDTILATGADYDHRTVFAIDRI